MFLEHERNYALGMKALVTACSRNTNGIMVWASLGMDALVSICSGSDSKLCSKNVSKQCWSEGALFPCTNAAKSLWLRRTLGLGKHVSGKQCS